MLRLRFVSALMLGTLLTGGCAMVHTSAVTDLAAAPDGVRIYPPRVFLMVDQAKGKSTIFIGPNFRRAYDVKPITIFAKQELTLELDEGVLKKFVSNQDTTAFLSFIKEAAQLATKAAGLPVSQNTIDGTFGLPSGIYEFMEDGRLVPVALPRP